MNVVGHLPSAVHGYRRAMSMSLVCHRRTRPIGQTAEHTAPRSAPRYLYSTETLRIVLQLSAEYEATIGSFLNRYIRYIVI